jgi:hypothetical protein
MNLRRRTTCRVCGSSALKEVIDLGPQYLQGSFRKEGFPDPPERQIPCTLVRCCPEEDENACGLLQMRHSVPPEILYSAYWYRSGTNQTMRSHLDGIVSSVMAMMEDNASGSALDIGCNDCTLMSNYPGDWEVVGIDPSDIAHPERFHVIKDLFPSSQLGSGVFDVITSIAMFYDLEDPVAFAKAIRQHLAQDGIWVVEMSYMPSMLRLNSYDTICHEHLEYYSFSVIERICRMSGLKVVRAELNESNGGSIRCYITQKESIAHENITWQREIREIRVQEFDLQLDTDKPYQSFQERINGHRMDLMELLVRLKSQGKIIHIYGASTKGNTILQWCGISSHLIDVAADRNPDKHGAFTLGTDIPIVSEEESRAKKPDYWLVLPWHFADEFMKRESAELERGAGFIFPLPEIRIVLK